LNGELDQKNTDSSTLASNEAPENGHEGGIANKIDCCGMIWGCSTKIEFAGSSNMDRDADRFGRQGIEGLYYD
jgi:hypothetical protein